MDSYRQYPLQPDLLEHPGSDWSVDGHAPSSDTSVCLADAPLPATLALMICSEYKRKTLTKLAGGNARLGCYALAVSIFGLGILRDHLWA